MMLKFWSFIYRLTGYYSDYAKARELEALEPILRAAEADKDSTAADLAFTLSLHRGSWQACHRFYRRMRHIKLVD